MGQLEVVEGYHNQIRSDVIDYIPRISGTLLDIGGGTGATAAHLKSIGVASRVGVIDQVDSSKADPTLDFHASGEIEDLDFLGSVLDREGPFDAILCLDILEHLVDPWAVVARLHQALVPGGHLIASIPNVRHWRVSAGLLFQNQWSLADAGILDRTHLRFFVKDTAVQLITHSGLELELVEGPPRARNRRLRKFASRLSRGHLDSLTDVQYVVRARRTDD